MFPPQAVSDPDVPLYLQIYRYYREQILIGSLVSPAKLPSVRALALHLGVSRNPVETAYGHLTAEGYIVGKPRSGYAVAPLDVPDAVPKPSDAAGMSAAPRPMEDGRRTGIRIDFGYDAMDLAHFPLNAWKRMTMRVLQPAGIRLFDYGDPKGEPRLRELVAEHVRMRRGVVCRPEQVVMTSGTQQSLQLLCALLGDGPLRVAAEAAMHPGIRRVFVSQRAEVAAVPLGDGGIDCEALPKTGRVDAVYVTPSRQFPYGMIMPAAARVRLLAWARERGAYLIEDDYDNEFRYEGRPLPALQGMDADGRVVYLGTFSKALAPGIRLSFIVLPPALSRRFDERFRYYDQTVTRLTQKTMELFMSDGHLDRHTRRMRGVYRAKRDRLTEAVRTAFDGRATLSGTSGGLHAVLRIAGVGPKDGFERAAEALGVRIYPAGLFGPTETRADGRPGTVPDDRAAFVVGFGGLSPETIDEGIRLLADLAPGG